MTEFPTMQRMPGGEADLSAEDFEPGVVAGMRSSGVLLLAWAALLTVMGMLGTGFTFTVLVDVLLGVQLLRLRHSWKLWALIRAWIGGVLAIFAVATLFIATSPALFTLLLAGQITYSGAVILLLTGTPKPAAILVGRVLAGVALLTLVAGTVWIIQSPLPADIK